MTKPTHELCPAGYPTSWPKANPQRPNSVVSVVTDLQKKNLYERNITTRSLALELGVKEAYLSYLFPGKGLARVEAKKSLIATRKEYRTQYATLVIKGQLNMTEAARLSKVPYRSMARAVKVLRAQGLAPIPQGVPSVGTTDVSTTD